MDTHALAYLAGVMDSDGWITIKRTEARDYPGSFTHSENIGCGQTSDAAVSQFQQCFGGTTRLRSRKGHETTWQPIYYWTVGNKGAAECIAALRPYLRVKARQADLLLAIRASKELPRAQQRPVNNGGRARGMDPAIISERDAIWQEIRSLNDRRTRSQDAS